MVAERSLAVEERLAFAAGDAGLLPSPARAELPGRAPAPPVAAATTTSPISLARLFRFAGKAVGPALAAERERGTSFVLIPVVFGAGAATNFVLARELSIVLLAIVASVTAAGLLAAANRPSMRFITAAVLIFTLGMLAASFETWRTGTKMLGAEISTRITGRVVAIEERTGRQARITIDLVTTERPQLRFAPDRIRIAAREVPPDLSPGQGITGVVKLLPPTGPVRPSSYDFSFKSYFDGIGASGFFLSGPFPAEIGAPVPAGRRFAAWVETARNTLAAHIRTRIAGSEGEVAAALVAGVRSGIPEEENEALRRTGLAHFISISGLHMALVAGTIVGGLRALFALFPAFSSRYPVKKFAALAALAAICLYLVISGAAIAAQRSFIMFAVMLVAVLFDRAALTMRNLAIAALIVLAIAPHEIMGPSFQMSFAATAALIGAYGWYAERRRAKAADHGRYDRPLLRRGLYLAMLFFGGLAMTSLIAGTATGLYGAWHFQRIAPLGLVANLAAMPIVTVAVMPMAVFGTLLIPLGLDAPFFAVMGNALAAVMAIARWLAERSPIDEVGLVPPAAVAILSVALAILTLATTWLRAAAVPLLVVGGALIVMRDLPDVLVSEDGRLAALRMSDGRLAVNRSRPSSFTVENWQKALMGKGVVRPVDHAGDADASGLQEQPFACGDGICLARHGSGATIAFVSNAEAAHAACTAAVLVIVDDATAVEPCGPQAGVHVITKRDLARQGGAAIRFTASGGIADVAFAVGDGERPWHWQRRFSREARGLPAYQRKAPDQKAPAAPGGDPAVELDEPKPGRSPSPAEASADAGAKTSRQAATTHSPAAAASFAESADQ